MNPGISGGWAGMLRERPRGNHLRIGNTSLRHIEPVVSEMFRYQRDALWRCHVGCRGFILIW